MKTTLNSHLVLAAIVAAAGWMFAASAEAAPVTWGVWTGVTNETAILTPAGFTYQGVNFNGLATTINNGTQNVVFTGNNQNATNMLPSGISVNNTGFAFAVGGNNSNVVAPVGAPVQWTSVLDQVIGDAGDNSASINLTGLSVGSSYSVQFFSSAPDANILTNSVITSGAVASPAFGAHAGLATRYIVANFTADATSQSFAVTGTEPTYSALVIGTQVAAQVVPEPASIAIWSLFGLLGLAIARFRRSSKR